MPRERRWRAATLLAGAAAGALVAVTALDSGGMDLRASSVTDLDTVARQERQRSDDLRAEAAQLEREVSRLSSGVHGERLDSLRRRVDALRLPAGLTPVTGPGLTVTLDDAPKAAMEEALSTGNPDPNELVVHQQDIQAVANALWLGGAEAMTIQGQRVVTTTGIKCVGNTVVLHGVPYAPPYRIAAVGDTTTMRAALRASSYLAAYRTLSVLGLRYDATDSPRLRMPGYKGAVTLRYAR